MRKVDSLKGRIARAPTNRRGYRQYGQALRADIKAHVASRVARGSSYKKIAKELDLAEATLLHWCKDTPAKKEPKRQPMGFRPVEVQNEGGVEQGSKSSIGRTESLSRPVVVLPNGIRVEGISVAELPELLGRLACY